MKYFIKRLSESTLIPAAKLVCWQIHEETGEPADWDRVINFLTQTNEVGAVFLACNKNQPYGIIAGRWNESEMSYEVRNLYVDEPHRGGSAARMLMSALLDWAPEGDAGVLIATREAPRPFYRKLGFEPVTIVSRASLKTLRERIGGGNGSSGSNYRRDWGPGPDESGQECAAAGRSV